jgi:hypothetical protein
MSSTTMFFFSLGMFWILMSNIVQDDQKKSDTACPPSAPPPPPPPKPTKSGMLNVNGVMWSWAIVEDTSSFNWSATSLKTGEKTTKSGFASQQEAYADIEATLPTL